MKDSTEQVRHLVSARDRRGVPPPASVRRYGGVCIRALDRFERLPDRPGLGFNESLNDPRP